MAKDPKRATAFYRDVLGLTPTLEMEQGAEFELPDGTTFGVWHGGDEMPWMPGNGVMFAVEDIRSATDAVCARGATVTMEPIETPVCHMAAVEDSEGNSFLLHQRK